jgi:DNA-binding transcriptional LysR family regulator
LLPNDPAKIPAMNWNDLQYVLAVARAGTLAGAARRLAVDETTVARRLTAAERALGSRLFDRTDGVLHPTRAGEAALGQAAVAEQAVRALELGAGGKDADAAGSVRLTAVPVLINRLIVPGLGALHARHSRLRLDLLAEPRNASLTRREADIALRLARPEAGRGVLARRVGRLDYAAYAVRGRASDRLPWIAYDEALAHLPHARWLAAASDGESSAALSVNDTETMLQAIQAGLGKSLLPCFVGDGERGLRRLGGTEPVVSRDVWLLTHRELRHQARMAAVVDWLLGLVKARLKPA